VKPHPGADNAGGGFSPRYGAISIFGTTAMGMDALAENVANASSSPAS